MMFDSCHTEGILNEMIRTVIIHLVNMSLESVDFFSLNNVHHCSAGNLVASLNLYEHSVHLHKVSITFFKHTIPCIVKLAPIYYYNVSFSELRDQ